MAITVYDLKAKISLDSTEFEQGLSQSEKEVQGFGGKFGSALGTVAKVGSLALGAASAALVKFGSDSIEVGKEFDKSMSQVQATMLKSAEEMEREVGSVSTSFGSFTGNLREFAQFLGTNTAFSATQAADALNYMALAGYDTQKSMEMLPNVLNLAAAGNMDLARASDMVTDTETAFGLTTERTAQMVDEMAKAASTGNTNVEQLGDAFLTVGGLAKNLNGGIVTLKDGTTKTTDGVQELEIALTAMANAGIKGSEAGTHMRNMLLKLSSPTEEGAKQLEALGVSVFDAEGNMRSLKDIMGDLGKSLGELTQEQKMQAISELFNTRDMASAEALLSAVGQDWDKIGESILNAEGAAAEMAEIQLDNLAGDITLFKSALEGAQIALSDNLSPTLREFVQLGTEGIQQIGDAIREGDWSSAAETLGNVVGDGVSIMLEKLPMVVEAGGQLISGLIQGFSDNAGAIADGIAGTAVAIVDFFSSNIGTFITGAINIATSVVGALIEHIPDLLVGIGEGIITALPAVFEGVADAFGGIIDSIWGLFVNQDAMNSFVEQTNQILSESDKIIESWNKVEEAKNQSISNAESEAAYYSDLWKELQSIVDQNGKVKEGYEERAGFIANELAGYTGLEISLVDGVVQEYESLSGAIDTSIEKIKAEAILMAEKSAYEEAIKSRKDLEKTIAETTTQIENSQEAFDQKMNSGEANAVRVGNALKGISKEVTEQYLVDWAKQELGLDELEKTRDEAQAAYEDGLEAEKQFTEDWSEFHMGNYDKVGEASTEYADKTVQASFESMKAAEEELKNRKAHLLAVEEAARNNKADETMVEKARAGVKEQEDILKDLTSTWESQVSEIDQTVDTNFSAIPKHMETSGTKMANTAKSKAEEAKSNVDSVKFDSTGVNMMAGIEGGVISRAGQMISTVAAKVREALNAANAEAQVQSPSRKMMWLGDMLMQGLAIGVEDNADKAIDAMVSMSNDMEEAFPEIQDVSFGVNGDINSLGMIETPEVVALNEISSRLDAIENNLYNVLVSAIQDGVNIEWNDRELARMVKTYA